VTLTVSLALAVAVTEGLGLLLLLPLLEISGIAVAGGDEGGSFAREFLTSFTSAGGPSSLPMLLGLYAVVMTARALLVRSSVVAAARLQEGFLLKRRRRLWHAMLESRWERLAGHHASTLSHSLTAEMENAAEVPSYLLSLFTDALLVIVYLGVAFSLSVPMTMLGVSGAVLVMMVLRWKRGAARDAAERVHDRTAELFTAAAEHVGGLKTTKAYGAEGRSEEIFASQSGVVARANEWCERLFADARAVLDIGAVIVLAVAVYLAHDVMNLGAAAILVLLYIFARITPRLAGLQSSYQQLMLDMPSFARTTRAIDHWESAAEGVSEGGVRVRLDDSVTLNRVHYRYPEREDSAGVDEHAVDHARATRRAALHNVTVAIAARKTTAIVGPSGAGKSTLADVVLGLLSPQEGRVEVDGVELTAERSRAWRERVGYVAQEMHLFDETIRANLRWAAPDATDDEMWDALSMAAADRFVEGLPKGLDTVVGERGCRLSSGERQRLTLARALLRRPELLLLDEATSNVDSENEREIQRAIESLKGHMTILLITHRLATIRSADMIYVMDRGRIVESGTFDSLLRRDGAFASLWQAQGIASSVPTPSLESPAAQIAAVR
jgi:ATP-binding cassette subfamily C protein